MTRVKELTSRSDVDEHNKIVNNLIMLKTYVLILSLLLFTQITFAAVLPHSSDQVFNNISNTTHSLKKNSPISIKKSPVLGTPPVFDIPLTYNHKVKQWIEYFQTTGRPWFQKWLERSTRYAPFIREQMKDSGLPQDLLYVAMIESGFSPLAASPAQAVGIWQFIPSTGKQYGLKINWWLDERKNHYKSTIAAIRYKKDLFKMFGSWYLVAASYNTGENRINKIIKRYNTNDFWELARRKAIPDETINYVPKIIAAALIAKSPALYGFRNIKYKLPYQYEIANVPGGTDLENLAKQLGVNPKHLAELNPELTKGFIPREVKEHTIKVPVGSKNLLAKINSKIN